MANLGGKVFQKMVGSAARAGKMFTRAVLLKLLGAIAIPLLPYLLVLSLVIALVFGIGILLGMGTGAQAQSGIQCYVSGPRLSNGAGLHPPMAPGSYQLTSGFGPRWGTQHNGQDYAAPRGTPIYAAANGVVVAAGPASGFGQWIVLDHTIKGKKVSTVYGHMAPSGVLVREGQTVTAGQLIAKVGNNGQSTGPHLHFEVWPGGRLSGGQPQDPMVWLDGGASASPTTESLPAPNPPTAGGGSDTGEASGQAPSLQQLMPNPPHGPQAHQQLTADRVSNAEVIIGVGKGMNIPPRGWVIALATALQESNLVNLSGGDRDSVGLFQQRPSAGWGTPEQLHTPKYAARKFYEAFRDMIMTSPEWNNWRTAELWKVAATVQRPAEHLRSEYAKWELLAVNIVRAHYGAAELALQGHGSPQCTSGEQQRQSRPSPPTGNVIALPVMLYLASRRRNGTVASTDRACRRPRGSCRSYDGGHFDHQGRQTVEARQAPTLTDRRRIRS